MTGFLYCGMFSSSASHIYTCPCTVDRCNCITCICQLVSHLSHLFLNGTTFIKMVFFCKMGTLCVLKDIVDGKLYLDEKT